MLQLRGTRLKGDEEVVPRAVDLDRAAGDRGSAADGAGPTGRPEDRVRTVLSGPVDRPAPPTTRSARAA